MATTDELKTQGHIHQWVLQRNRTSKCIASFNSRNCIKIGIQAEALATLQEEWSNYTELCQSTDAKRDYDEMRVAYKYKDKQKMAEILRRVTKRCVVDPEYQECRDEKKYQFNYEEYLPSPESPDPMSPKNIYITT
jgi:hypothetical protein